MDCTARIAIFFAPMMPPRPPLNRGEAVRSLRQYVLMLQCECGHTRTAQPKILAGLLAGMHSLMTW
jgi:hypothetical protein